MESQKTAEKAEKAFTLPEFIIAITGLLFIVVGAISAAIYAYQTWHSTASDLKSPLCMIGFVLMGMFGVKLTKAL